MRKITKVTVLMTVFNGEQYIQEAIDSILTQTFRDFEFLIIDDCSTDNTVKIIKKYQDPRVRLIENEKNIGFIKSLNLGIAVSKGEYIARQDADDISLSDRILEEVTYLDNNPDIAMVATAREIIDEDGHWIRNDIPKEDPDFQDLCKNNMIQHSSIMIRRNILDEFGGYSELFPSCEDLALWLSIAKKYKIHIINKILCKLRIHKESVSVQKFEEQALSRIFVIRMVTGQLADNDMEGISQFGLYYLKDKLNGEEQIYYLSKLVDSHRKNENFSQARKIYLQIFIMDPANISPLIQFFRLLFGKRFVSGTTKIYNKFKYGSL